MAGDAVENDNAQQEKPGPKQAHDQVACGGNKCPATFIFEHNKGTGSNGVDFHKNISDEKVVGEDKRQHGNHQQTDYCEVKIHLLRLNIFQNVLHPAEQSERHHKRECGAHQRFQGANANFIAPRGREVTHPIDITFTCMNREKKNGEHEPCDEHIQNKANPFRGLWFQHTAGDAACQIQHDGCKRKILYKCHQVSSALESRIISSSSSVW